MKGRCLCGAVTVRVDTPLGDISACHCDMCRRWSGAMQMGIEIPREAVTVTGKVKTYQSSAFAERAWCDICGSALWIRDTAGSRMGSLDLVPGLFDNAGGAVLTREVYADSCPDGYALAGNHDRISKAEYEMKHSFVAGGENQ